jgi:hypothetical protein
MSRASSSTGRGLPTTPSGVSRPRAARLSLSSAVHLNVPISGGEPRPSFGHDGAVEDAIVRLTRKRGGGRDWLRSYRVVIDGEVVGKLKRGATEEFVVKPGRHSLCLKIDWKGSEEVRVTLAAGDIAPFVCAPNGSAATGPVDLIRKSKPWIALAKE